MSDVTLAAMFVLMLIAPCAIALTGQRRKAKGEASKSDKAKIKATPTMQSAPAQAAPALPVSGSIPVFAPVPGMQTVPSASNSSRPHALGLDPYEKAARIYAQPESSFVQTNAPVRGRWHETDPLNPIPEPEIQLQPVYRDAADIAAAEALFAQAAAAKAHAAELVAAAKAAQAKALAAAERVKQAALAAELAHQAANHERGIQAQITAQEHARTASGEHLLPESHPSLDFPRSGPRRAA